MPKIECVDVANVIAEKQSRVYKRWQELSETGLEPGRQRCMAILYDGLQDIQSQLPCKPTVPHNPGNPVPSMHIQNCYNHCEIRAKGREFLNLESESWERGCREGCEELAKIIKPYWDQLREWAGAT